MGKRELAALMSLAAILALLLATAPGCAWLSDSDGYAPGCSQVCHGFDCGVRGNCDCGTCWDEAECKENMCQYTCEQRCASQFVECGPIDDDCDCGTCADEFPACDLGQCVSCEHTCSDHDHECGAYKGCDCGTCVEPEECVDQGWQGSSCRYDGKCEDPLTGDSYECGESPCGGNCGTCEFGDCIDHMCFCEPQCEAVSCGADGCGGTCPNLCSGDNIWCYNGQCLPKCGLSGATFSTGASRVVLLEFGKGGHLGEALDVDLDPDTCSPPGDCEGGLNNQVSGLIGQLEQFMDFDASAAEWLAGDLVLLKELVEPTFDGQPFVMRFYHGQKAFEEGECEDATQPCPYDASFDSFSPFTCEPYNVFDNATIVDGRLHAGGPEYTINIVFKDAEGIGFEATLHQVVLEADVVVSETGPYLENGLTAGALRKAALMAATEYAEEAPVSDEMMKNLLEMFLVPDIDIDGDGELDGVSYGVKFATVPATIVGVSDQNLWGINF